MKFLDKIKDLFVDEEEVIEEEVIDVNKKEEEHKLPTFMRNKIEEEEKREERKLFDEEIVASEVPREPMYREKVNTESVSDNNVIKTRSSNFSFPIDMDDDTFTDNYVSNRNKNVLEKEKTVSELYTKKEEPKPKKFRPTPVISPIYGVLDKNYTKDEVKVQDETSYEIPRSKKVDFESVRNKAFGSLTDDIRNNLCENCELYKEVKITKKAKLDKDNLLSDMTEETKEDITLADAEDNYFDFGVDYEVPKPETKKNKIEKEDDEIKIVNHNEEESTAEKVEVKEEIPKRETKKVIEEEITETSDDGVPLKEENDIFNLMDSMYEGDE